MSWWFEPSQPPRVILGQKAGETNNVCSNPRFERHSPNRRLIVVFKNSTDSCCVDITLVLGQSAACLRRIFFVVSVEKVVLNTWPSGFFSSCLWKRLF